MSQVSDVVIAANPTGLAMRTELNDINGAFNTNHKGSSAPGSIAAGTTWIDDTNNPLWDYYVYDGSTNIKLGIIDTTNNLLILDQVELKSTRQEVKASTSASNAMTLDLDDGAVFSHTTTENTTVTFSNPAASGKNSGFKLFLTQDATGRTITWPGSVIWPSGAEPDVTTPSAKYVLVFETIDAGTIWYGTLAIENAS